VKHLKLPFMFRRFLEAETENQFRNRKSSVQVGKRMD